MTDRYADLRAALDAATPGPWKWVTETCERGPVWKGNPIRVSLSAPRNGDPQARTAVLAPNWNTSEGDVWQAWISCNEANAAYIAACHPEAIRALLADHDTYRRQAQHETDVAHAAFERVKALEAERDAFADVLEAIASIKATPGRAKADALLASVVNLASAALAQGQGGSNAE